MSRAAQARFWVLVALFVLLIAGSIDIGWSLWEWSAGDAPQSAAADAVPWFMVTTAMLSSALLATAGVLGVWCARCLRGWWLARSGTSHQLASSGTTGVAVAIVLLALANAATVPVLIAVASLDSLEQPLRVAAGVDVLTVVSNVWVLLYYWPARRWDGARVRASA